jgi:hypothetical protein
VTPELAQKLATVLGVTAFDARQRLVGKGPAVVAIFADPGLAESLLTVLNQSGFQGFVINAALSTEKSNFVVQHFVLEEDALRVADSGGRKGTIAYGRIKLLLPALSISGGTETSTVTERKFSIGKTLMAGGLPMTKKTQHKQVVSVEGREKVLYLCLGERTRVVCPQDGMVYSGLGQEMKPSGEMNFNYLVAELRQRCPSAFYDDRLLRRAEQVKLLGPLLNPDNHLDLAVEILAKGFVAAQ